MLDITIIEAYSRLKSLRKNAPDPEVETKFVTEFHGILDLLENGGIISLSRFRVPASELRPLGIGGSYETGETYYSDEQYCDAVFFRMKVDGVLTMFEVLLAPAPPESARIGFHARQ